MFESHGDMQLEENHTKPKRVAKRTQMTINGTASREKRKFTAFTSSLQMLRVSAFVRIRSFVFVVDQIVPIMGLRFVHEKLLCCAVLTRQRKLCRGLGRPEVQISGSLSSARTRDIWLEWCFVFFRAIGDWFRGAASTTVNGRPLTIGRRQA